MVFKISNVIKDREEGVFKVTKGFMGSILTSIVRPMFIKGVKNPSSFYVTDKCISCGKCEKVCTSTTIKMEDNKPVWCGDCNQCLACYHSCPVNAIQYGKATKGKGQYINPYFKR